MGCTRLNDNLVGGVIGCQVSNFSTAVWLVHCLQEESSFLCLVRDLDIATAYDEDHAYFNFGEILGALKKESSSNHHHGHHQARSWPHLECAVLVHRSSSISVP